MANHNTEPNSPCPDTIGWKIFRQRKDGTLGPLFIDATQRVPMGVPVAARDDVSRKGFAKRIGWHAAFTPEAPHLMTKAGTLATDRVWCRVALQNCRKYDRPESQGGSWVLAQTMTVLSVHPEIGH